MDIDSISLDKLLLDEDTKDQFIRGLMGSVALAVDAANKFVSDKPNFYQHIHENSKNKESIYSLLSQVSRFVDDKKSVNLSDDLVDSSVYDHMADVVDKLLDCADIRINDLSHDSKSSKLSKITSSVSMSMAMDKDRLLQQHLDIPKPQLQFLSDIDNSRERPFKPRITMKDNVVLNLVEREVEPLSGKEKSGTVSNEYVKPKTYFPHPYEEEIKKFEYQPAQLECPKKPEIRSYDVVDGNIPLTRTRAELLDIINELNASSCTVIAIDLEHHQLRSFQGFTCLIQISTTDKDYLIDAIALRRELSALNVITTNKEKVKVFHGCESDILWLQKDFGIYVVNCFDTYQAAKLLKYPSLSLAHLLKVCCNINANKRYQLSDWRQRPLPPDMLAYARSDTHYLIPIYNQLRYEVWQSKQKEGLLFVLDASRKTCLQRYEKEFFWPLGYRKLLDNPRQIGGLNSETITPLHEAVLAELWNWRDLKARELDESTHYVMSNAELLRIGSYLPRSLKQLDACSPLSSCVQCYKDEVLKIITNQCDLSPALAASCQLAQFGRVPNSVSFAANGSEFSALSPIESRLYGRALKTPSKEQNSNDAQSFGQSPSPMPSTPPSTGPFSFPYQPYHQSLVESSTIFTMSPPNSIPTPTNENNPGSPILTADEVFKIANWSSGLGSTESVRHPPTKDDIMQPSTISQSLKSLDNIPSSAPSDKLKAPLSEREKLISQLSKPTSDDSSSDLAILEKLPESFSEIYKISNEIRQQKVDKKRIREPDDPTPSPQIPDLSRRIPSSSGFDGTLSAAMTDKRVMGRLIFDESIYLRIANENIGGTSTMSAEKDIETTLDTATNLGWIKDGNHREEIKQQHLLDLASQAQPDSDGPDSRPRSASGSPTKQNDPSKYASVGALPQPPRAGNPSVPQMRRSNSGERPGKPISNPYFQTNASSKKK